MASSLDSLIKEASDFISSEFNLQIKKSQLKIYSPKNWKKFYEANKESIIGFQKNEKGERALEESRLLNLLPFYCF